MELNRPRVTVRLHGPLAEKYGSEFELSIATPRDAVNLLEANFPGFRRDFLATKFYAIYADGEWREPGDFQPNGDTLAIGRSVDICPQIEGRFFAPIVAGLGFIGITGIAANIIAGVILVGLMVGVSMLLAPKPKKKTSDDANKNENYMFSGPDNVTEQGVAVPIIYGQVFTGSVVISSGLEVAEGVGILGGNWSWQ